MPPRRGFAVTVRGEPIRQCGYLEPSALVDAGVAYSQAFEEWDAAHEAGISLWEWEHGEQHTAQFKARVIAWARLRRLIANHRADASAHASKVKERKRRRK